MRPVLEGVLRLMETKPNDPKFHDHMKRAAAGTASLSAGFMVLNCDYLKAFSSNQKPTRKKHD